MSEVNAAEQARDSSAIIWLVIVVLALVALLGVVAYNSERMWYEVVGNDLVRVEAPEKLIADAMHAVLDKHQNWIVKPDGKKSDPTFKAGGRSWSVGKVEGEPELEVTRAKTELTDKNGNVLSIERIYVSDTPCLLFIEYADPEGPLQITNELVRELNARGVELR